MMKRFLCVIFAFCAVSLVYASDPDTVKISAKNLNIQQLKPGLRQYVVTVQAPDNPKVLKQSLWNRQVSFEKVQGKERLVIRQNWIGADTLSNRTLYSICEKNFTPVYHYARVSKGITAFNFEPGKVVGADSVKNNYLNGKGFSKVTVDPVFNWELDLEFWETLSLKDNTVYLVNFYHPGGQDPKYHAYLVTGSEKLVTVNNTQVDCWKLHKDYGDGNYGTFWISKKTHEVLKMEESFNGVKRNKVKLATVAGRYL